ncbi:MAG: hypothetical protein ABSG71_06085 [Thermodesulfobacteriota bacterium]|jgi:predicted SprT family Zn-dependent metalloprotease
MVVDRPYKRDAKEVMQDFPELDIEEEHSNKRKEALLELLACIPEEDYQKLKKMQTSDYRLFIPFEGTLGKVHPFVSPLRFPSKQAIVYLSPILEGPEIETNRVIAVAAHELAHIFLGHHFKFEGYRDPDQEKAAWSQVCRWGFQKEAEGHLKRRKQKEVIHMVLEPSIEEYLYSEVKGSELND